MKSSVRILVAASFLGALVSALAYGASVRVPYCIPETARDTVVYQENGYRLRMRGDFSAAAIDDSLLRGIADTLETVREPEDTLPALSARDTLIPPDSLRLSDPFRFEYYAALLDPGVHREVRDSLLAAGDTLLSFKLDSIYVADSCARVRQAFLDWYAGLSKEERKKYDFEQKEKFLKARNDSIRDAREAREERKDSIRKATPRILDTYALPEDMHYRRIVAWTLDTDFEEMNPFVPDTGYNSHFHDRRFQQRGVGGSWLGVDGSPVQPYDWFDRGESHCTFFEGYEAWTYTPRSLVQYNTKSPYTELCYYGTLLSTGSKEQDNVRFLTTQNITPAFNFQILYERFGGGGMLVNEETKNKTFAAGVNYLGRRYVANAGFISDKVSMGENGGITDVDTWVRDTTVEVREIPVGNSSAASLTSKSTWFLDHRYSIPFEFINTLRRKVDPSFVPDTSSYDITTAYIGHSFELSDYARTYTSAISPDSLEQKHIDNKLYLRLQPWSRDALLSRVEGGAGIYSDTYLDRTADGSSYLDESSFYAYAGAGGQLRRYIDWGARAQYVFGGTDAGDFDVKARIGFRFCPFRKARTSPVSITASAGTSLLRPDFYCRHMYSADKTFRWDNDFTRTSVTRFEGRMEVPYWKMDAKVGYALLDGNVYYANPGIATQNGSAMSVLSAYLRKDIDVGGWLHFDNRLLFQYSSDQEVVPLPTLAGNLRWYFQFVVQKAEDGLSDVMTMQIGADARATTPWYAPGWVPALGVFFNQDEEKYTLGPTFDIFVNIQWKRACIFIKYQNAGMGWPLERSDYFSAHGHIVTASGMPGLKLGITWPFYPDARMKTVSHKQ